MMDAHLKGLIEKDQKVYKETLRWVIAGITDDNPRSKISFCSLTREFVSLILQIVTENPNNPPKTFYREGQQYVQLWQEYLDAMQRFQDLVDIAPCGLLRLIMNDHTNLVTFCFVIAFKSSEELSLLIKNDEMNALIESMQASRNFKELGETIMGDDSLGGKMLMKMQQPM